MGSRASGWGERGWGEVRVVNVKDREALLHCAPDALNCTEGFIIQKRPLIACRVA